MADVKWIKITTNIFDDEKMLLIESMPAADSIIVIWFKLLALAGKQNNDGVFLLNDKIAYTDDMLAAIFRRDINTVRLALDTFEKFGMVELIDGVITIPNWSKHQSLDSYEKKKERDRVYQAKRREKQKLIANKASDISSDTSSDISPDTSSDTSPDASSDVAVSEIEEEKEIDNNKKQTVQAQDLFERLWALYPLKKGKGAVSRTQKLKLLKIGYGELERAIKRYMEYVDGVGYLHYKNGSTFFNSGYVDYLDCNYCTDGAGRDAQMPEIGGSRDGPPIDRLPKGLADELRRRGCVDGDGYIYYCGLTDSEIAEVRKYGLLA